MKVNIDIIAFTKTGKYYTDTHRVEDMEFKFFSECIEYAKGIASKIVMHPDNFYFFVSVEAGQMGSYRLMFPKDKQDGQEVTS